MMQQFVQRSELRQPLQVAPCRENDFHLIPVGPLKHFLRRMPAQFGGLAAIRDGLVMSVTRHGYLKTRVISLFGAANLRAPASERCQRIIIERQAVFLNQVRKTTPFVQT